MNLLRLKGPDIGMDPDDMDEEERNMRVVLTAPHKDLPLEAEDVAFMLVQYTADPDDLPEEKEA